MVPLIYSLRVDIVVGIRILSGLFLQNQRMNEISTVYFRILSAGAGSAVADTINVPLLMLFIRKSDYYDKDFHQLFAGQQKYGSKSHCMCWNNK